MDFTNIEFNMNLRTEPLVHILLATYNGEKFIHEQIESIISQTHNNWRLVARDDGSLDNTLSILLEYSLKDNRIIVIDQKGLPTGSASGNFSKLLNYALTVESDYFALADQDDVWLPFKLQRHIEILEGLNCKTFPLLLHSDLKVVSDNLSPISESFIEFSNLKINESLMKQNLLTKNSVTGCTCIFNKSLINDSLPFPATIIMHDWWLALVAAYRGRIVFDDQASMLYRQHRLNSVGAKSFKLHTNLFKRHFWKKVFATQKEFKMLVKQIKALSEHLQKVCHADKQDAIAINSIVNNIEGSWLSKYRAYKYFRNTNDSVIYNFYLFLKIFLYRRD